MKAAAPRGRRGRCYGGLRPVGRTVEVLKAGSSRECFIIAKAFDWNSPALPLRARSCYTCRVMDCGYDCRSGGWLPGEGRSNERSVGQVESLVAVPRARACGEKSCRRPLLDSPGVYGDRLYAFRSSAAPQRIPFLYRAGARDRCSCIEQPTVIPTRMSKPTNSGRSRRNPAGGITPLYADPSDLMVEVETPDGRVARDR